MTWNGPDLKQLYARTLILIDDDRSIMRALNWVEQVLPHFVDACRLSLDRGAFNEIGDIETWLAWIESERWQVIAEAGKGEAFQWRTTWLKLLLETTRELNRFPAERAADRELADTLWKRHLSLPACFTASFWGDLVGTLRGDSAAPKPDGIASPPAAEERPRSYRLAFPLVLSAPVVDGGSETNVILAEFILDPLPVLTSGVHLSPEQAPVRCMDARFAQCFQQAAAVAQQAFRDSGAPLPDVRVRIQTVRPGHERFLHGMVLRGESAAGALAVGLYALYHRKAPIRRDLAISFALCDPRRTDADGRCHAVGEADAKVRGCAKQDVRRLLVAREQQGDLVRFGYIHGIEVLSAATFEEAAELATDHRHGSAVTPPPDDPEPGPVPAGSRFYIARQTDLEFLNAVRRRHGIILIKGPRQVGKSSLLARGLDAAYDLGMKTVLTDFQKLNNREMQSPEAFYKALARMLERELDLKASLESLWVPGRSANINFEEYMEDHVLPYVGPLVWGMDEVDLIFLTSPFSSDVFGLFRSWANERQARARSPWHNVTMVMAYATEAHLFIKDLNQSPFNIGTLFELHDFTVHEVEDLNQRYGSPMHDVMEIARFFYLVGGHPYLVRIGLSTMVRQGMNIDAFEAEISHDRGPIGEHMRRIMTLLVQNEDNVNGLRAILKGLPCPSYEVFYHLRSAGVIVGDALEEARPRCQLYASYFERHLPNELL